MMEVNGVLEPAKPRALENLFDEALPSVRQFNVNDCIARIEFLKMSLFSNHHIHEHQKSDLLLNLDILRSAFLYLDSRMLRGNSVVGSDRDARWSLAVDEGLEFDGILGENPVIVRNLEKIARIAPTEVAVLLEGETGAGKEMFVRIIHLNSRRKKLVAVNCGAFPQGTIESELFGHVKGAYTGATSDRKGLFEEANDGTIFLDEVGDLDLQAQVKLLRVLDHGELQRVGSDKVWQTNARIIAATNQDLDSMVAAGTFRKDLYYRLNVCHLLIPPLRERRDEIELLLEYFTNRAVSRYQRSQPRYDSKLYQFLINEYDYPGNIRELKNLGDYLTAVYDGRPLEMKDLPDRYLANLGGERALLSGSGHEAPSPEREQAAMSAEREYLIAVFKRHSGDIKAICEDLGLSRSRVYQLTKKYDLPLVSFRSVGRRFPPDAAPGATSHAKAMR